MKLAKIEARADVIQGGVVDAGAGAIRGGTDGRDGGGDEGNECVGANHWSLRVLGRRCGPR